MRRSLLGFAHVLLVLMFVGCGLGDAETSATPTPQPPDKVVGVIIRCEAGSGLRLAGEECTDLRQPLGLVQELTIRTASGSTYVVSVAKGDALFDQVKLGDAWPP